MAARLLSEENLEQLRKNEYVLSATPKRIIYTKTFKQFFIEKYQEGFKPTEIFKMGGFDVAVIGYKRIERASERWISASGVTLHKDEPKFERLEVKLARQQKEIERLSSELEHLKSQVRV